MSSIVAPGRVCAGLEEPTARHSSWTIPCSSEIACLSAPPRAEARERQNQTQVVRYGSGERRADLHGYS